MYGLTEAFRSSSLDPALVDAHPDSVGTAIPFAELMVVRADGSGGRPGEEGELVHAGPLVAQGYWNDAARTAERFKPAPAFSKLGGTAVWSGDTVVKGDDGLLRFRGRDDAMIKVSGNRISPTEIEEAALASGAVSDAAAFGVPDERLGQAIVLVAVAKAARRTRSGCAPTSGGNCRRTCSRSGSSGRTGLPVGPNGKLDRTALKAEIGMKALGPIPPGFEADSRPAADRRAAMPKMLVGEAGGTPLFVYDAAASPTRWLGSGLHSRRRSRCIMP